MESVHAKWDWWVANRHYRHTTHRAHFPVLTRIYLFSYLMLIRFLFHILPRTVSVSSFMTFGFVPLNFPNFARSFVSLSTNILFAIQFRLPLPRFQNTLKIAMTAINAVIHHSTFNIYVIQYFAFKILSHSYVQVGTNKYMCII